MFSRGIVWKGLVYAVVMMLAKLACGLWLVRISVNLTGSWKSVIKRTRQSFWNGTSSGLGHFWPNMEIKSTKKTPAEPPTEAAHRSASRARTTITHSTTPSLSGRLAVNNQAVVSEATGENNSNEQSSMASGVTRPRSLYPASIIGCAMVARGEIGFLISSVAESSSVFSTSADRNSVSDISLIVTWAIVLCTILGPIVVGILVQRVKRLQNGVHKEGRSVHRDVLGIWRVS